MALHQVRRPHLPVSEQSIKTLQTLPLWMPPQQFSRGRRCAGPRVKHGNIHFATREGLIKDGEITNHQGQQSKTQAGLNHSHRPCHRAVRRYVAKAQGKESRAAIVEIRKKTSVSVDQTYLRSKGPVQRGETEDQSSGPEDQQRQ